jgi:hypothetical protein
MLAALIASQSLVTLVSAAPAPNDKNGAVVNLPDTFVQKYKDDESFQKVACFFSKEPKKCAIPTDKSDLEFLFQHHICDAITTTTTVNAQTGSVEFVDLPFRAYCYVEDNECGKITTANFRKDLKKNKNFFVRLNALCYARWVKENRCSKATDPSLCKKFHKELYEKKKDAVSEAAEGKQEGGRPGGCVRDYFGGCAPRMLTPTDWDETPVSKPPTVEQVRVRDKNGNYRNGIKYDYGTHTDIDLN